MKKSVARAAPRQRRNPEATKQRIVEAARDEFCEHGLHGARIDRIARRAKANKRLIYHYVGGKDELYLATLERAYARIRAGEQALHLESVEAEEGMVRLVRFTFQHFLANPDFIRLLIAENMNEARYLRRLKTLQAMHSPLIEKLRDLLARGAKQRIFRQNVDPLQLYISIAALGFFYLSNIHTLSTVFNVDLRTPRRVREREDHITQFVLAYLKNKEVETHPSFDIRSLLALRGLDVRAA